MCLCSLDIDLNIFVQTQFFSKTSDIVLKFSDLLLTLHFKSPGIRVFYLHLDLVQTENCFCQNCEALWGWLATQPLEHVTAHIKLIQMHQNAAVQDCAAKLRQTTAAPVWDLGESGVSCLGFTYDCACVCVCMCVCVLLQEWSWWSRTSIRSSVLLASLQLQGDWWRHVHIWRFLLLSEYFLGTELYSHMVWKIGLQLFIGLFKSLITGRFQWRSKHFVVFFCRYTFSLPSPSSLLKCIVSQKLDTW